ncbi:MAG: ImuA family protein [Hyphomonadaceae bacterium]
MLGFALAWACVAAPESLILWATPETARGEDGVPYADGLAQFGVALDRLLTARSRTQEDALWAVEQGLRTPKTLALCAIAPSAKPLSLTATRRLLLAAETHNTRCVLLRFDRAGASAAWTRWIVSAAPSQGARRELGPPRFNVQLVRNRAGPSGQYWLLEWNAHEHAFHTLDGAVAAAPADRPADARQRRAV